MHFQALATDYDGTLAWHGQVEEATLAALRQLRSSGRKLILVTGRELSDLASVCPHLDLFERVVAEDGALLVRPDTGEAKPMSAPPPARLVRALRERGVQPLGVGRVIVATLKTQEATVVAVIRELGLDLEVIFNKEALMVLPRGVNKATGLAAALRELGLSPHHVVGVGDAENDLGFLRGCGFSVAVANALPVVKEAAHWVTRGERGAGVCELIAELLANDLAARAPRHDPSTAADPLL
jgi:hydroxymethylpyrimidine pyrophosphatase-like HAD family hydrolase